MDFILYFIVFACIGWLKLKAPVDTVVGSLISNPGEAVSELCVLPVGKNLSLLKEKDAYTLILEELGLK